MYDMTIVYETFGLIK